MNKEQKKGGWLMPAIILLGLLLFGGIGHLLLQRYGYSRLVENTQKFGVVDTIVSLNRGIQKDIKRIPSRLRIKEHCEDLLQAYNNGTSKDKKTSLNKKNGDGFTARRSKGGAYSFKESKVRALLERKLESTEKAGLTDFIIEFFEH